MMILDKLETYRTNDGKIGGASLFGGLLKVGSRDALAGAGIFSSDEVKILQDFKDALGDATTFGEDYGRMLTRLSPNTRKFVDEQITAGKSLDTVIAGMNATTTKTKLLTVATKALSAALTSALIGLATWALNNTINAIVNYEKELAEQAKAATDQLNQQQQTISNYSSRIQQLYSSINSGELTLDEHVEANRELRTIQQELIDNFGDEARGIDLVTQSIDKQNSALEKVNSLKNSQYLQTEWENNFNKETTGQKWLSGLLTAANYMTGLNSAIGGIPAMLLSGYNLMAGGGKVSISTLLGSNLDQMEERYTQFSKTFSATSDEMLNHIVESYDNVRLTDSGKFEIFGNVEEVRETIVRLQNDYKSFPGYTSAWNDELQKIWQSADGIYQKYGEAYNAQVQMEVASNEKYLAMQEELQEIYSNYEAASISGDDDAMNKAAEAYKEKVKEIRDKVESTTYEDVIINIVPKIADPNLDDFKNKISELFKNVDADDSFLDLYDLITEWTETFENMSEVEKKSAGIDTLEDYMQFMADAHPELLVENGVASINEALEAYGALANQYSKDILSLYELLGNSSSLLSWDDLMESEEGMAIIADLKIENLDEIKQILLDLGLLASDSANLVYDKLFGEIDWSGEGAEQAAQQQKELYDWINTNFDEKELELIVKADTAPLSTAKADIITWVEELKAKDAELSNKAQQSLSKITDAVTTFNTKLKPQFDELGTAYNQIFNNEGGFQAGLASIDTAWFAGLQSQFTNLKETLGEEFDASNINAFFDAIQNGGDITEEVAHRAFNDLATAYFYAADGLGDLNEETANSIKQMMEQMGIINADEIVDTALAYQQNADSLREYYDEMVKAVEMQKEGSLAMDAYGESQRLAAETVINSTNDEIAAFYAQNAATEEARQYLFALQLQELAERGIDWSDPSSVNALLNLANAAGVAGDEVELLTQISAMYAQQQGYLEAGAYEAATRIGADIERKKAELEALIAAGLQNEIEIDFKPVVKSGGSGGSGDSSGAKEAAKSLAEEIEDEFQKELDNLEWLRDNNVIDEKTYLDQLFALIERHFGGRAEVATQYYEKLHDLLSQYKSYYESAMSDVVSVIDKEISKQEAARDAKISALESERDAREKALESERSAAEKSYKSQLKNIQNQQKAIENQIKSKQSVIDGINDEIDALRSANDERQRAIDLQAAEYALQRSLYQKNVLVYTEDADGKGQMRYRRDDSEVREKQQDVEDAKLEIEVAAKEKQIALIEKEIDLLNSRKDALSDQADAINDAIDAMNDRYDRLIADNAAYYEQQIADTKAYYESIINPLDEYKKKWQSISDFVEQVEMTNRLKALGLDTNTILSASDEAFETFKRNYLSILADLNIGNEHMLTALAQVGNEMGLTFGGMGSYLGQMGPLINELNQLDLTTTASALGSVGNGIQSVVDGLVGMTGDSVQGALDTLGTVSNTTAGMLETDLSSVADMSALTALALGTPESVDSGGEDGTTAGAFSAVKVASEENLRGEDGTEGDLQAITAEALAATDQVNAIGSAIEALDGKEAHTHIYVHEHHVSEGGGSGGGGASNFKGTVGNAFAKGYPGLPHPEKNALRSEFGQPELTVYPNGTYELTTQPTFSDLPKGTTIFNEEQTNRILKGNGKSGKAFAEGNSQYLSLKDAMPEKAALMDRFEANLQQNLDKINSNIHDIGSTLRSMVSSTTSNISNTTNTINVGDIHVTCPGVTETEVAKNLGSVIKRSIDSTFFGMNQNAYQRSMRK